MQPDGKAKRGTVELEASDTIFRFYPPLDAFVPDGQNTQNGGIFNPSTEDKEEAKRTGTSVRVSVWDLALTTCEQAKSIRSKEGKVVAYGLGVIDVLLIRDLCNRKHLRVVRDPLETEKGPGHQGHCGLEGVDRLPKEERKAIKTLRDLLAQHCFVLAHL